MNELACKLSLIGFWLRRIGKSDETGLGVREMDVG